MVNYRFVAMAGLAAAVPLNINLGAYSPALVVGDGEISFGGRQDVSSLMNALEGAAVNAANGAAAARPIQAPATPAPAPATPAPAPANAAAIVGSSSAPATDPALQEQAQQIAALQGMGKEIAPRELSKRDITGFDRALKFAESSLGKSPKVQLGTGEKGSGVGILVENSGTAAAPAAGAAKKRDVEGGNTRVKVTTMYVRSGVPDSLKSSASELSARDISAAAAPLGAAPATNLATRSDAIDAVNLNVDGNQGVTMTFVETITDAED